jgi:heat shock protein HtpX
MYKQIAANKRKTIIIMIGFVIFISLIGCAFAYAFNDWYITIYVLVISSIYALIQYFAASHLAIMMTGAKEVSKKDCPRLYKAVENLSITAGLPMPKVYVIDDKAPNAFATGRDPEHAMVAATSGLIDIMDDNELTAVMAHEMSHVKNYDIRISMIVFGLVCLVGFISDLGLRMLYFSDDDDDRSPVGLVIMLLVGIFAPIAASLAQLAISREREYLADISAVKLTRYPEGMINALKKLDEHGRPMRRQNSATSAMYINNPMKKGIFNKLFSTHPPIEDRIERLENAKTSF